MSRTNTCTKFANDAECKVFRGHTRSQGTLDTHIHCLGLLLQEALCRQHMLDFAGADTNGKDAQRAMRRGMGVAAHKGHAGERDALFRSNDMHNALSLVIHVEECKIKIDGVLLHRCDTQFTVAVYHVQHLTSIDGWYIVVKHRDGGVRTTHRKMCET